MKGWGSGCGAGCETWQRGGWRMCRLEGVSEHGARAAEVGRSRVA
jgi:hypothetical protein